VSPRAARAGAGAGAGGGPPLRAVVFDCDGVILESEDLHRQAYNATFHHFQCRCPGETARPVEWSTDFYDDLQNKIGGGSPRCAGAPLRPKGCSCWLG